MFGSTVSIGATVGDGKKRELGFVNKKKKKKKLKVEIKIRV